MVGASSAGTYQYAVFNTISCAIKRRVSAQVWSPLSAWRRHDWIVDDSASTVATVNSRRARRGPLDNVIAGPLETLTAGVRSGMKALCDEASEQSTAGAMGATLSAVRHTKRAIRHSQLGRPAPCRRHVFVIEGDRISTREPVFSP